MQLAQSGHALVELYRRHPRLVDEWNRQSNNLVVLRVGSEDELVDWAVTLQEDCRIPCVVFTEPDLGDQVTAVAVTPTDTDVLRRLPLAG